MDARLAKEELRRQMLQKLRAIPAEYVTEQSARLRHVLQSLLDMERALAVFMYAALPHEIDLLPLISLYPRHAFYFPRCLPEKRLVFHRVTDPTNQLRPGIMGIRTPHETLPTLPTRQADLVIVPGLAFTATGCRLGYGGGYYDRLIADCPVVPTVSLAMNEQLLPELPTDTHDMRVARVFSPKE